MTREEEIKSKEKEWIRQFPRCFNEDECRGADAIEAFEAGAKWADNTMIKKACDYLYKLNRMNFNEYGRHCPLVNVRDFREAMES